jgi:hypothetical protein
LGAQTLQVLTTAQFAFLLRDTHVIYYKFPDDLANHINDLPDPNYLFW